jgi:hypothetical protein
VESLIAEAINIHGLDFLYIPRKYVAKDVILGEDRLSEFPNAYPIVMYMENSEGGFQGQGAFLNKFGLTMEQSAIVSCARKTWMEAVGHYETGILPDRPCEGDLIYFPLTNGLFEIMFVQHQDAFYQLGQPYIYKLTIELFRYSSETLRTNVPEIDAFNDLKTTGTTDVEAPLSYGDNNKFKNKAAEFVWDTNNPFGE